MWYIVVFGSIALMLISYRAKKFRLRNPALPGRWRFLANDTATVSFACLVLALIFLLVLFSAPSPQRYRALVTEQEHEHYRVMASYLVKQLRDALPDGKSAIVVARRPVSPAMKAYHEAMMTGVKDGFGDGVTIHEALLDPGGGKRPVSEQEAAMQFSFSKAALDKVSREFPDARYLVSFVGVPDNYSSTNAAFKARQRKLAVGILTDNVYLLGGPISLRAITACVVPKRRFEFDVGERLPEGDLTAAFEQRYWLITPENVADFWRRNRLMMKVTRVM